MDKHAKRDRTARFRIRRYLASHGAVEDASGYATGILKEAIDYQGTSVAFIQLVAAMERDGEIVREIRGKRTYRICLAAVDVSPERPTPYDAHPMAVASGPLTVDYERLAQALVRQLMTAARDRDAEPAAGAASFEQVRAERDEYAARLELAQRRLRLLLGEDLDSPVTSRHALSDA